MPGLGCLAVDARKAHAQLRHCEPRKNVLATRGRMLLDPTRSCANVTREFRGCSDARFVVNSSSLLSLFGVRPRATLKLR